jgi:hypothetical protein
MNNILRPISKYNSKIGTIFKKKLSISYDVVWKIKKSITYDVIWKIPLLALYDVIWKIRKIVNNDVVWRIPLLVSYDVIWKIPLLVSYDVVWKIKKFITYDVVWKIPLLALYDVVWKIRKIVNNTVIWKLKKSITYDVIWKLQNGFITDVTWQINKIISNDVIWRIKILSSINTAYILFSGVYYDCIWRVQPVILQDIIYRLKKEKIYNSSYSLKKSPFGTVSWKIIENEGVIPGVDDHIISANIAGTELNVGQINIHSDIDAFVWLADITLLDQASYDLCTVDTEIIVTIDSVSWILKIVTPAYSQKWVENSWQVTAVSCTSDILNELVSLTLTQDMLVADVASTVLGSNISFTWNAYNWVLLDELVIAENNTKKETLQKLVEAVGGIILSDTDGVLKVINGGFSVENPTAIWNSDNIYQLSKQIKIDIAYNRVLVGSSDLYIPRTISIEIIDQDNMNREIVVAIYVAPEMVQPIINMCALSGVTAIYNQLVTTEIIEQVVITDGIFSVSKPIDSFTSIDYLNCADLGAITVLSSTQCSTAISGHVLAEVTYNTTYYKYLVKADSLDEVSTLFCASVPSLRSDIIVDCQRDSADKLSPEVLLNRFCITEDAAKKRGKAYLDDHAGGISEYNLDLVWDGSGIPEIGSSVKVNNTTGKLTSLSISATFPNVEYQAVVEI